MITVATDQIADVTVNALGKLGSVIPELPAWGIDNNEQAQFITGIHKGRVLRTMSVTDDFQTGVAQLFCITPVNTVGYCIAYHSKILMSVGANQRTLVGFSVQPETVFALEFNATDTDSAAIAVYRVSFIVADTDY